MNFWEILADLKIKITEDINDNKYLTVKVSDSFPPIGRIEDMLLSKKEAVRFAKELISFAYDLLEENEEIK